MKKFKHILLAAAALLTLGLVSCNVETIEKIFDIALLYNSTWKGSAEIAGQDNDYTLFLGMDKTATLTSVTLKENPDDNVTLKFSGTWTNDKNELTITLANVVEGHLDQPLPITLHATVNGNVMTLQEYEVDLTREFSYPQK